MSILERLFGKPKKLAKTTKTTKSTKTAGSKRTTSKSSSKPSVSRLSASSTKATKPQKVYRNEQGKVVYRQTTDKIGDILVNPAGVKYKITGESFHAPTGYDDGKLKVRILTLTPLNQNIPPFEMLDQSVKDARDKKIFSRMREAEKNKQGKKK